MVNQIVVVQGCDRRQCDCAICWQNVGQVARGEEPSLPVRVYKSTDRWSAARHYKARFHAVTVATRLVKLAP
ncbi:MAG TPA: hypothetical protein VFF31_04295 [Blastocatellia bacterium]|nr:hypothetical protein [Blastocatellia bacterium]